MTTICKMCKFHRPYALFGLDAKLDKCVSPPREGWATDYVTGKIKVSRLYCDRKNYGTCKDFMRKTRWCDKVVKYCVKLDIKLGDRFK